MNVLDIVLTSDEEKYDVKYRLQADFKLLGHKLKKDMPKVKKGLEQVTSDQIKLFLKENTIKIENFELDSSEVKVIKYFEPITSLKEHKSNMDGNVICLLDCKIDKDLAIKGYARELINRVQRLRKKANMVPTDDVNYYIIGRTEEMEACLTVEREMIEIALRGVPKFIESPIECTVKEEQEIMGDVFELYFKKE